MTTQTLQRVTLPPRIHSALIRHRPRFHATLALLLSVLAMGEMLLACQVHLSGMTQLFNAWPGLLLLLGCLFYCERRPLPRLIDSCELTVWAVLSSNVLAGMIQIAARSPFALADKPLALIDRKLHFNTSAIVHLVERAPALCMALDAAYLAIPLLVFAAILVPPFFGQRLASRRYVAAVVVATVLTSVLFALWPACGPWTTQSLQPTAEQAAVSARLLELKSSAPAVLDLQHTAIVSFPSFHVILAVLSAVALNGVPRVRRWAWALATLTSISTITTGWHYGVDVLGGLAVSLAASWIARLAVVPEAAQDPDQLYEPLSEPADSLAA